MTTIPFATRTTCPDCGADVIAVHQDSTTVLADKVWSSSRGGGQLQAARVPRAGPVPSGDAEALPLLRRANERV